MSFAMRTIASQVSVPVRRTEKADEALVAESLAEEVGENWTSVELAVFQTSTRIRQHLVTQRAPGKIGASSRHSQEDNYHTLFKRLLTVANRKALPEGFTPPTHGVLSLTVILLTQTRALLRKHFPRAAVAPDGDGGVRIEWSSETRDVRLVIPEPSEGQAYIYYEDTTQPGAYEIQQPVTSEALAKRLLWFADAV